MLETLLKPNSIAVIGASQTPGKVGHEVVANLKASGFPGAVYPVNPNADQVLGLPCYPDVKSCPQPVDLGVVAVPTSAVLAGVEQAINAGVRFLVVLTAGFKEVGEQGRKLEEELRSLCASRGARLMGPNCIGLINTHHRMNASFSPSWPNPGGISVISQSGALCVAILDWASSKGVGLGTVVSFGNKADLNEVDFLQALAEDDHTTVIAGYLENVTDGDEFLRAAEHAAGIKPVIIFKAGFTQAGVRAASSHTGSLVGEDIAYGAALRRAGVIRAKRFDELFDYAQAFATQPLPGGSGIAVLTNAGGPGIMAADAVESSGLTMAALEETTRSRLRDLLPEAASTLNPVDVLGDADPERFAGALRIIQDDPGVHALVVLVTPQGMTRPEVLAQRLAEVHDPAKPLLTAFMGGRAMGEAQTRLNNLGIPNYASPERAVAAAGALCDYAAWKSRPPRVVTRFPVNHRRIERILRWHERMGRNRIAEVEAKEILKAYGFNVLDGGLITTADAAVELAERIGYPVVMKICSPDVIHKSDFGGVRLNLANAEHVRDAFDLMSLRISRRAPDARIRGMYVERMGARGREVILGMTRDLLFGPMLMFGLGGIFVEVMKDVTFHIAPITADEAMQMLKSTRSYDLLEGARGQGSVNLDAIALGLQRISQLAMEYPKISELDINPFIVGDVGVEPYVADARMSLKMSGQPHE